MGAPGTRCPPTFPLVSHHGTPLTDSLAGMLGNMLIRETTGDDWPAIWPFLQRDIAAGETFCCDRDMTEDRARETWCPRPPGRTVVAVDDQGAVVGVATVRPTMVGRPHTLPTRAFWSTPNTPDGASGGLSVRTYSTEHAPTATVPCSSTRW